ncbi:MAG: SURF1 family protein [Rickettsiales bacterium]|nr:SURF1 family protein [Rickettsiales bacterium]
MTFTRPKPIPLLISLTGFVLMMVLGAWQVQRLMWKEALIAEIEHAVAQTPLSKIPPADQIEEKRFYSVKLTGNYMAEHQLHIAARYFLSQLGYHILVPFKVTGDDPVLVNVGWIPAKQKDSFTLELPKGKTTITAQIRTSNERNPFTPENQPEKNIWFGRDAVDMGTYIDLDAQPFTLDLLGEQDFNQLPVPSKGIVNLRNDHLGYAITWFSVGFGILVIFILYHRKPPANPS